MEDFFKPRGSLKGNKPDAGNSNIRSVPVFAVVKDNIDPVRSGRLRVYIADFSGDNPDNASSWVTVSYMSPFYGRTNGNPPSTGYGNYKNNPHSYGMWTSPPDIGTTVICIFVNGDPNFGFWIGCVPDPDALHMVPAIGATNKIIANQKEADSYGGATFLPVTNINSNDPKIAQTAEFLNENKPIHSYSASVYAQQGLIRDNIRGPLTTNAQRESPSRVGFGISTPGRPIYEGGYNDDTLVDNLSLDSPEKLKIVGRRGGHTFIMDDGDLVGNDRVVRLRTTLGHQILLSDSGQCLHIIHANGQSWIELGKEGTIDMYSTNSVNIRTQGDLNLHADNNININAAKDLSIQAESIKINSEKSISMKSGTDFVGYAMGKYTWKVDGAMAMSAGGEGSYASASTMFVNGSKINLNTGKSSVVPVTVPPLQTFAHTDTLYDSVKGFAAAPGKLLSIVSRAPAHAPWANAGQGVNVKTTLSAEANFPKPASQAVATAAAASESATPPTPTVVTIATVPPTNPVSAAIDKNTTAGAISAQAVKAATGAAAQAVRTGVTVVTQNGVAQASVGSFAMSPKQMEEGGYLKPGTAEKIAANISSGMPPDKAFDPAFFTGKNGVNNLADFNKKLSAQSDATVTNMQRSQTGLQIAGVITGQEAATQITGPILAGVQVGVSSVVDAVKTVAGNIVGDVKTKLDAAKNALGVGSDISNAIKSGNLTANLTDKITSGLPSLATSLTGIKSLPGIAGLIESAKNVSQKAFTAITDSFKAFKANVPVDTLEEAKKNVETSDITGLADKIPGLALSKLGDAASRASGISALPGGQQAISAVVDKAGQLEAQSSAAIKDATNTVRQLSTAATNNISTQAAEAAKTNAAAVGGIFSTESFANVGEKVLGSVKDVANLGSKLLGGNLAQTVLKGLPPGLSAQIQGAISSISSGGNNSLKLPQVAEGTNDRAAVESTTAGLLNDPDIPPPNYSGTTKSVETIFQKKAQLQKEADEKYKKIFDIKKEEVAAADEYERIATSYPEGSPELKQAEDNLRAKIRERNAAKADWEKSATKVIDVEIQISRTT